MKLALGTVQFGVSYGVANKIGQVGYSAVSEILQYAREQGVDTLDTAIAYGESEQCLGDVGVGDWNVITKLPELSSDSSNVKQWVRRHVECSLERLNLKKVSGLLLHRPLQLLSHYGNDLWDTVEDLKKENIVEKVGFSIYAPDELDLLYSSYQPDIVQVSYNIFDRRIKSSGWLEKMANDNVEVHVRSIFLQGLLLMNSIERPNKFGRWSELWESWGYWLQQQGITPIEACLAFVFKESLVDKVIVGVDSKKQLEEILSKLDSNVLEFPNQFEVHDLNLINPSNWDLL